MKTQISTGLREIELGEVIVFQKKSNIKAGEGTSTGKYKFFTSSDTQSKYLDKAVFDGEYLIFSTGGQAAIHYCNEQFSASTDCFVVKVDERIETKYVYCFLLANIRVLEAGFRGAGLQHISKEYIRKIRITYPENKSIQKKIVSSFENAEKLRGLRKEADELTRDFLRAVFLQMFGDPMTNTKKWQTRPIFEFGEVKTGNTPSRQVSDYYGDYIDWIKSDNLDPEVTFITKAKERLSEKGAKVGRLAPKGSVLVACIAGSISSIGRCAIADREVAFNQQINAIIPKGDVNSYFLHWLIILCQKKFQDASTQSMKGMLSKGVFEKIELIYPSSEMREEFGRIAANYERTKSLQYASREMIGQFYESSMQKAFKGELV